MKLKNKVVVITGGTKGLGKALALSFLKEDSKVTICARNEEELLKTPEGILGIKADVIKEKDLKNVVEIVKEKFGQIDIWINNAGIWLPHASIEETNWERAHNLMEVNLFGTVYGSKLALIEMRKQGFGLIMSVLSTAAIEGKSGSSAYCASKHAVVGFLRCLKKEIEGTNIKTVSIYPGGMQTNFFDEKKPENYEDYMNPNFVAEKVIENLKKDASEEELIIKHTT